MINFEKLEKRLKVLANKKIFIKQKNVITYSEFLKLQDLSKIYPKESLEECVEGCCNGGWGIGAKSVYYTLEVKCSVCGNLYIKNCVSKDWLLSFIYQKETDIFYRSFICDACEAEKEKQQRIKLQKKHDLLNSPEYLEKIAKEKENASVEFENIYLNSDRSFVKGVTPTNKFYDITKNICNTDLDAISDYINNMDYHDFLETPYWDAVRSYKLYKSKYKCALCNKTTNLQVHHKTYQNHGMEHENLDDLIVLCKNCHAKYHNKEVENE